MEKIFQTLFKQISGLIPNPNDFVSQIVDIKNDRPKLAFLGMTGVGKSSTINCLFGTRLKISHITPGTLEANKIRIRHRPLTGKKGELDIYDLPGLNEDIDVEEATEEIYKKIIPKVDVVVWIFDATSRAIGGDQKLLKHMTHNQDFNQLSTKLVFAINKADDIKPRDWAENNLPSPSQLENIEEVRRMYFEKISKIVPSVPAKNYVIYSAERKYRLNDLFLAMIQAAPQFRRYQLNRIKSISDGFDTVDERILSHARKLHSEFLFGE